MGITDNFNLARRLYRFSDNVGKLVLKIISLLDENKTTHVNINGALSFNGLEVAYVEREKNTPSMILIHWVPNFNLSLKTDPFCSAFILDEEELQLLYKHISNILAHN